MKEIFKGWQDFWAEFFRIKHLHSIHGIEEWNKKLVTHIVETLGLRKGDRILDLACGGGMQALELARRGKSVVGVDMARVLVDYGNESAKRENLTATLIQGDMREVRFTNKFDACLNLSGSFGFFDDNDNIKVLIAIERALKNNGKFYIEGPNPLNRMRREWRGWEEIDGGYLITSSDYDPKSGKTIDGFLYITNSGEIVKYKSEPEDKGFSLETRIYTLSEMVKLIEIANLKFISAYGSIELPEEEYNIISKRMIVVGEKSQ